MAKTGPEFCHRNVGSSSDILCVPNHQTTVVWRESPGNLGLCGGSSQGTIPRAVGDVGHALREPAGHTQLFSGPESELRGGWHTINLGGSFPWPSIVLQWQFPIGEGVVLTNMPISES